MRIKTLVAGLAVGALVTAGCGSSGGSSSGTVGSTAGTSSAPAGSTAPAATGSTGTTGTAPKSLTEVSVGNPGLNATQIPLLLAEQKGYFADHGLKISQVSFQGGPPMAAAMIGGSLDVATLSPFIVGNAVQSGNDLAMFCGVALITVNNLLAPANSPLKTQQELGSWQAVYKQFKGKKVGVPIRGGDAETRMRLGLIEAGVDPNSVTFVAIGVGPPAQAAFEKNQVDVFWGTDFIQQNLVGAGQAKVLTSAGSKDGPTSNQNIYGYAYSATRKWIEANGATAKAFCAAIGEGVALMQDSANQGPLDQVLTTVFKVPVSALPAARATAVNYSTEMPQSNVDDAVKVGVIGKSLKESPKLTYTQLVLLPS
jgi:NitT/TauT family transport system substrate-binding protein